MRTGADQRSRGGRGARLTLLDHAAVLGSVQHGERTGDEADVVRLAPGRAKKYRSPGCSWPSATGSARVLLGDGVAADDDPGLAVAVVDQARAVESPRAGATPQVRTAR